MGCTTVRPPARVENPVRIYVLYTSTHTALAIPDLEGKYIAWGFGDRHFMTAREPIKTLWGAVLAIVGSIGPVTPGSLERIRLTGTDADTIAMETGMRTHEIMVDAARVAKLSEELEDDFQNGRSRNHDHTIRDAEHGYSVYWHGCGDVAADWCRQLGAKIPTLWAPRWGRWKVDTK